MCPRRNAYAPERQSIFPAALADKCLKLKEPQTFINKRKDTHCSTFLTEHDAVVRANQHICVLEHG